MSKQDVGPRGGGHSWLRSNILGLVAIFIALSGTAVAADVASQKHGTKAVVAKKKKKPRAGPQGPAGPQGAAGTPGQAGANGTAVAFAAVLADGSLAPNDPDGLNLGGSKAITQAQVTKPMASNGVYCFDVDGVRSAIATVNNEDDTGGGTRSAWATVEVKPTGTPPNGCPLGTEVRVMIVSPDSATPTNPPFLRNASFYIWFE
jgi:hypothetical protein